MDRLNGPSGLGSINFITGSLAGKTIQLHKATLTLGREPSNDIVVSDPSISRRHAQITLNGGIWIISNLTQQNTVTVNQRDVPSFQQSPISERDTIRLGAETTFLFLPSTTVSLFSQPAQNTQSPPQAPSVAPQQQTFQNVLPYNPTMAPPPPPGQVQRQAQGQQQPMQVVPSFAQQTPTTHHREELKISLVAYHPWRLAQILTKISQATHLARKLLVLGALGALTTYFLKRKDVRGWHGTSWHISCLKISSYAIVTMFSSGLSR